MTNMNYCKFENTLADLRACDAALVDCDGDVDNIEGSDSEKKAARKMLTLISKMAEAFCGMVKE